MADPTHVEYLLVVLHSFVVMPEERFDALALDHLRHHRAAGQLKAIKEQMLDGQHAYRLVLRGKPYLARLRRAGSIDGRPTVTVSDVVTVLSKLATLDGEAAPPKKREYL